MKISHRYIEAHILVFSVKKYLAYFRIGFMNIDWIVGQDSCAAELIAPMPSRYSRLFGGIGEVDRGDILHI